MITDVASFLRFFDGVRRRTERDVAALPPAAAAWRPASGWSIGDIVDHICTSRLYFARAYRQEGWIGLRGDMADPHDQRGWLPALQSSAARFVRMLEDTPDGWLTRRIETIDTRGMSLSGWRILMMAVEHEVHHRSQIDAYAGLQGWPVPDIFNRSAESIAAQQAEQQARHGR